MKAYGFSSYGGEIKEKEITRYTESFIFYKGYNGKEVREGRNSHSDNWYLSEKEAVKRLKARLSSRIENTKEELTGYENELNKLQEKYPQF